MSDKFYQDVFLPYASELLRLERNFTERETMIWQYIWNNFQYLDIAI